MRVRIGALFAVVALGLVAGCSSTPHSPTTSPSDPVEEWEKVIAGDDRFSSSLEEDDMEMLCNVAGNTVRTEISTNDDHSDFSLDTDRQWCGNMVGAERDDVVITLNTAVDFYTIDRKDLEKLAEVITKEGKDASLCLLTDEVGAMSVPENRQEVSSESGEFCEYSEIGNEVTKGYTRGSFITHNSMITIIVESIGSQVPAELATEVCKNTVEVTVPALLASLEA